MPENTPNKDKTSNCKTNGYKFPYELLVSIQKDTLISQGKILIELQHISDGIENMSADEKKDDAKIVGRLFRIVYFLLAINAMFAGIKLGEITGLWKMLF